MTKTGDWTSEELAQVVTKADKNALKNSLVPAGNQINVQVSTCALINAPKYADVLGKRYKTMNIAWVALSLKHPDISLLSNLRLESYQAFSDYVLSKEIAGLTHSL